MMSLIVGSISKVMTRIDGVGLLAAGAVEPEAMAAGPAATVDGPAAVGDDDGH